MYEHSGISDNFSGEACLRCEAAIAELVDGTLSPTAEVELRAHAAACSGCAALLQSSEDGKAWLRLLHDSPPAVPDDLFARILAQTSAHPVRGLEEPGLPVHAAIGQALAPVWAMPASRPTRWLMTAAMAFFSIAASLSVAGVHADELHPAVVQAAAYRQFFDVKKQVVSFYDNLALVRELEATMDGMHRNRTDSPGNTSLDQSRSLADRVLPQLALFAAPLAAQERMQP